MRSTFTDREKKFIEAERVLRFNSTDADGGIHCVPLCFGFDGQNFYFHRRNPTAKRWRNVEKNEKASVELDSYSDDWSKLRGVLAYGNTRFVESGKQHGTGLSLLQKRYVQYSKGAHALNGSTVIVVFEPTKVVSWYINK